MIFYQYGFETFENYLTVGIANNMRHLSASPIGATIVSKARLTAIEGRKLTYHVEAHDSVENVAEGTHTQRTET